MLNKVKELFKSLLNKDKEIKASLFISLNIHILVFGLMILDFSDVDLKLSFQRAMNRLEEIMKAKDKTVKEKIEQVVEEINLDLKQKAHELSKVKIKKADPVKQIEKALAKGKNKSGDGKEKEGSSDPRGSIKGFAGFLPPPMEVSIIERPKQEPPPPPAGPDDIIITKMLSGKECDDKNSFGGVGMQYKAVKGSKTEFEVDILAPGQPAELAGIMKGDVIKGDPIRFRGEKGTSVEVEYFRNGQRRVAKLVRSKICYKIEKIKKQDTKKLQM